MRSGMVLRILDKTKFDFAGVAGSSGVDQVVSGPVDVSQFRFATMAVRVFDVNVGSGAEILISAVPWGNSADDPSKDGQWKSVASGELALNDTAESTTFLLVDLDDAPMGAVIAFIVRGSQPASPGTLNATITIDLVLKN